MKIWGTIVIDQDGSVKYITDVYTSLSALCKELKLS